MTGIEILNHATKTQSTLMKDIVQTQYSFLKHILLLASTVFGILVSLKGEKSDILLIDLSFALSMALISLGILFGAIALYNQIDLLKRTREKYTEESLRALAAGDDIQPVFVTDRILFVFCEKACYISLILSILILAAYSIFVSLL